MKYYLLIVGTIYDGLEFTTHHTAKDKKTLTQKDAETIAQEMVVHHDSGEELDRVELIKVSKKEYEVLRKLHI